MAQGNWRLMFKFLLKTSVLCIAAKQGVLYADSLRTEATFRTVFVNAGYSAAFGAAAGAAMLPFFPEPALSNLRYVAAGASIGFVVGSGVAFYRLAQGTALYTNGPNNGDFRYPRDSSRDVLDDNGSGFPLDEFDNSNEMYSRGENGFESGFLMEKKPSLWDGAIVVARGNNFGIGVPNIVLIPGKNDDFSKLSFAALPVLNWKF